MASDYPDDPRDGHDRTISSLSRKERADLRRRGLLPLPPGVESYYRQQAQQIRALELRVAVLTLCRRKKTPTQIAQILGITYQKVMHLRRFSVRESARRHAWVARYGGLEEDVPPRRGRPHLRKLSPPKEPPMRRALPPPTSGASPGPGSSSAVSGELLDAPDVIQLRRDCLTLRKAMKPFDQMADLLGISEKEARRYTYEALKELQDSEMQNSDLERRLMIEQIDQMIAAIHPLSTGQDLEHGRRPVVLEAIDRSLKLMKQKADLLGLSEPPAVDIRLKLQEWAAEGEYDIVDLEDVAREVLTRHKIRLPEL